MVMKIAPLMVETDYLGMPWSPAVARGASTVIETGAALSPSLRGVQRHHRHCEERSDVAIQEVRRSWIAALRSQ